MLKSLVMRGPPFSSPIYMSCVHRNGKASDLQRCRTNQTKPNGPTPGQRPLNFAFNNFGFEGSPARQRPSAGISGFWRRHHFASSIAEGIMHGHF